MTHPSEDRLHAANVDLKPAGAQIIPFERPPNVLQRAVQVRAQEALERDRDRQKVRPAPLRWAIILVLATIPVFLLLGAVDAFVRVFHHVNASFSLPAPQSQTPAASPADSANASAPRGSGSEPGVVMLQPLREENSAPKEQPAAPAAESN